jgi:hypothetical protein
MYDKNPIINTICAFLIEKRLLRSSYNVSIEISILFKWYLFCQSFYFLLFYILDSSSLSFLSHCFSSSLCLHVHCIIHIKPIRKILPAKITIMYSRWALKRIFSCIKKKLDLGINENILVCWSICEIVCKTGFQIIKT